MKASSNGANTDGTSQIIGNALGVRPSIKFLRIGAIFGVDEKAAIFGVAFNGCRVSYTIPGTPGKTTGIVYDTRL